MRTFGLIGYPLSHSFSQEYFTKKFQEQGITDCKYLNFPIHNISHLHSLLKNNADLKGLNVTIPYKEQVIPYLDVQDEVVMEIGACNCIHIRDEALEGFNTDVIGFEISLVNSLQFEPEAALILGTGGASKAVAYTLMKLNIPFSFVSRKAGRGQFSYEELNKDIISKHQLIVNTSPVGMYPAVSEAPEIPYEFLDAHHHLYDLVYNPVKSLFLQKGAERGAFIQNGLEMLQIQAEESWNIWNM